MENPRPPTSSETIGLAVHDAGPGCSHIFVISSREAKNVPWSPRNTRRSASNATNPHSTSYIPAVNPQLGRRSEAHKFARFIYSLRSEPRLELASDGGPA